MAEFTPGLELARSYYREVVRPLIDARWPGLAHSAALLGQGSEVLGFDTERSTDHDWGPRLQLFVDADGSRDGVASALWAALPATYRGLPTRFESRRPPLVVSTPGLFFEELLGFDPRGGIGPHDWLGVSWQRLGEATAGAVFHDGLGELEPIRSALRWYPEDLWRYVLACQWQRIGQEEAFVGRCAEVGDALGSAVVTARLVRDVMHLWLLMARRYPPYSKWLGTAFARLAGTGEIDAGEIGVALDRRARGARPPVPRAGSVPGLRSRPPSGTTGSASRHRWIRRYVASTTGRSWCSTRGASPPRCSTRSPIPRSAPCHRSAPWTSTSTAPTSSAIPPVPATWRRGLGAAHSSPSDVYCAMA
jgi:hypothetical protein